MTRISQFSGFTPARRWLALRSVLALMIVAGLGVAGWYVVGAWQQSEERSAALAKASAGRHAEAIPALRQYLEQHPDDAEVLTALVSALIQSQALPAEIDPLLDRLAELRPNDPLPFRLRAEQRNRAGCKDEALADARRALELAPEDHATRRLAAWLAVDLGQYPLAEQELAKLLATSPYSKVELGAKLALARWQARNFAGAEDALTRYVPPNSSAALVLRGVLHYEAGQYDEAIKLLRSAKPASDSERLFALNYLALSLARQGNTNESRATFDELNALYRAVRYSEDAAQRPSDLSAQVRAARAQLDAGRPQDAARQLEAIIAGHGPDPAALQTLADCYEKLGRSDLASAARRQAANR